MISRIPRDKKRWLFLGAGAIALVLLAGTVIAVKVREESRVRADADAVRAYIAAGKYDEARAPLESWLKARPRSAEAFFLLAREMFSADLFEQGFIALEKARTLGYPSLEVDCQRAIILERLGRHEEAEPILRRFLLTSKKPDPEAYKALVKCYFETFRLTDAENVIDKWIREAPGDVQPHLWRIELGRKVKADSNVMYDFYQQALKIDPNTAEAHLGLAELYLQRHQVDEAIAEYQTYSKLKPESSAAFMGLGLAYLERGDEAEAVGSLERAARLEPGNPTPLIERGKLELRRGRFESAISFFRRALEIEDDAEAHYQISLALTRLGRLSEAQREQETSARLREEKESVKNLFSSMLDAPHDVSHQYRAARWLIEHKHGEEGVRWAQKILREHPEHAETNRLLADYYQSTGDHGLANYYRLRSESR